MLRTVEESQPFLPRQRPVYPKLTIVDDGADISAAVAEPAGEVIRLRRAAFVLGRNQGDLTFPAETMMSGEHAKISLDKIAPGVWCWMLHDLESRHGLFIRIKETFLENGCELLIGATKLRISLSSVFSTRNRQPSSVENFLCYNSSDTAKFPALSLESYSQESTRKLLRLTKRKYEIGSKVEGNGRIDGDPFMEPHHLTLHCPDGQAWKALDQNSYNGTWLRIRSAPLTHQSVFMAGEQRFHFHCD
jgi:hypothetical protein